MNELRVTHLSRHREGWNTDLGYDGWFLRFSGEQEAFDAMRNDLKRWGRMYARWMPDYPWRDGKKGAWWVDDDLFRDSYTDRRFEGMQDASTAILKGDVLQWIAPYRAYAKRERPQAPLIPLWLMPDYRLLELPHTATAQEAKAAYKSLAKKYHPDTGGSHDSFIALQCSYNRVMQWAKRLERVAV
jgi:DnaJ domain